MIAAPRIAAGAAAVALAAGGFAISSLLRSGPTSTASAMDCEGWSVVLTQRECFAAGAIRNVALYNLQGAAQFCVWEKANPGEWSRLKGFATSGAQPASIVSWFGGAIRNQLEAYFAAGGPTFTIQPNTAPNRCRTPLPAPVIQSVTPGQTDATVTLGS